MDNPSQGGWKRLFYLPVALATAAGLNLAVLDAPAAAAAGGGRISGTVKRIGDAVPVAGATVKAYVSAAAYDSGRPAARAVSGADGTYTLSGLQRGSYLLLFNDYADPASNQSFTWVYYGHDAFLASQAEPVAVTNGGTATGIDGDLFAAGKVSGRVTDTSGNPLSGIMVSHTWGPYSGPFASATVATRTDANGRYTLTGLGATEPQYGYEIEFNADHKGNYAHLWYDNTPWYAINRGGPGATTVQVVAGQTTTGIDAKLYKVGHLRGTVTNNSGAPMGDINVLLRVKGTPDVNASDTELVGIVTNADGSYDLPDIPVGRYDLAFNPSFNLEEPYEGGHNPEYSTKYYGKIDQDSYLDVTAGVRTINPVLNWLTAASTSLTSSANPSTIGQPVTYTVVVDPTTPLRYIPSGMVVLNDDTYSQPSDANPRCGFDFLTMRKGVVTCTIVYTTPGVRHLRAVYQGDEWYKPSFVGPVTQTILNAPFQERQCKDSGWRAFTQPAFSNQGQCVSFTARQKH